MKRILTVTAFLWIASLGGAELTLVDAVKAGNRTAVSAFLKTPAAKTAVNVPEADGTTALHWAVRSDDLEIARILVGAGANPNVANRYGLTPLSIAASNANGAMVGLLREAGGTPGHDSPGRDGSHGCREPATDAVRLLLERGADANARTTLAKRR